MVVGDLVGQVEGGKMYVDVAYMQQFNALNSKGARQRTTHTISSSKVKPAGLTAPNLGSPCFYSDSMYRLERQSNKVIPSIHTPT